MDKIKGLTLALVTSALTLAGVHFLQKYKSGKVPANVPFGLEKKISENKREIVAEEHAKSKGIMKESELSSSVKEAVEIYKSQISKQDNTLKARADNALSSAENICEDAIGNRVLYFRSSCPLLKEGEKYLDNAKHFLSNNDYEESIKYIELACEKFSQANTIAFELNNLRDETRDKIDKWDSKYMFSHPGNLDSPRYKEQWEVKEEADSIYHNAKNILATADEKEEIIDALSKIDDAYNLLEKANEIGREEDKKSREQYTP